MVNKKIFISYANPNKGYAEALAGMLREYGFQIWFNGQIKPGEDWEHALKEALNDSSLFIPIVSDEYMESEFALFELGGAMGLEKNILPIVVSGDLDKMPFRFKKFRVVDAQKTDQTTLLHLIEQQANSELAA